MDRKGTTAAVAATVLAAVLWGTSFNVNDAGLAYLGPSTFVLLRFALAAVATLAVAALLGRLDASPLRSPWFWLLAAFNALGFFLQYVGQTMTTPARTALFVNTSAFAVALLDRVLYKVRVGPRRLAAIALGVGGAAILITGGDPRSLEGGRLLGDLVVLSAGVAWSVFFVMNRKAVTQADPLNVTAWTFALTAILLVPTLLLDEAPLRVPPQGALAILYAGLVTTALAFGLWAWGLTRLNATASAVLLLVEILVASVLSAALGRETFGVAELAGAGMLVGAVVGMSLVEARKETLPAPAEEA
jgi:DME family drug/metabolite transporter